MTEAMQQHPRMVPRMLVLITQSRLTLCSPMDCSLSGSSVHGILQARMLEWAQNSLKLMSIESVMPSSHHILCRPLLPTLEVVVLVTQLCLPLYNPMVRKDPRVPHTARRGA